MRVIQAYRFALDPTPAQEAGAAVALRRAAVRLQLGPGPDQGEPGAAGGRAQLRHPGRRADPGGELVGVGAAQGVQRRQGPGGAVVGGELQGGLRLRGWRTWRPRWGTGRPAGTARAGPGGAVPGVQGQAGGVSVRFTTGSFGLAGEDRRHVRLPRIGLVRTHESTRKLARRIEAGTARIRSVTVSLPAGPLAGLVLRRNRPGRARPGPARCHRGRGRRDHAPGGTVHRPDDPQPPAAGAGPAASCGG